MPTFFATKRCIPGIVTRAIPFLLLVSTGGVAAPPLNITVIEGDAAINNIRTRTAHNLIVEVRDETNQTVPGATVIFQAPITGASISFAGGQKTLIAQTDNAGRVTARGLRPNSVNGSYEIRVTAAFKQETATALITQTNASPSEARSSKKLWLFGLAAGAVAGGVFAASHGSTASGPSALPTQTGSIVAGPPAFGPPH